MNRKEIIAALAELLSKLRPELTLDAAELDESVALQNDLGIDSITMLMLALSIEKRFGFRFESVTAEQMKTLGSVCEYIEARRNK